MEEFISAEALKKLPTATAARVSQAIQLFRHYETKTDLTFSPVFTPLQGPIDASAQDIVFNLLVDDIPKSESAQKDYFAPYMNVPTKRAEDLRGNAKRIQRLLVYNAAIMPTGVLIFCLQYAASGEAGIGGIFKSVRQQFGKVQDKGLLKALTEVYDFRNTYVAHQEKDLKDVAETRTALKKWVDIVARLHGVAETVRPR
jgi:type III restriction enzyme